MHIFHIELPKSQNLSPIGFSQESGTEKKFV